MEELFGSQHKNKNMQMTDTKRDATINQSITQIAGKKLALKGF